MYESYLDNTSPLHSIPEGKLLVSPKLSLEINNAGSFDFTILPTHPLYDSIKKMKSEISVKYNGVEIFSGRATKITGDLYNRKKVYCEGELAYLNDSVQRPGRYQDVTVRGYLKTLLDVHNAQVDESKQFQIGAVTVADSNDSLYRYTNWENTLSVIKKDLVDSLGGYLFIRKENGVRYLDYLADFPNTSTQIIQFGKNLLDFSRNFDATDIATAIIPLGAKLSESEVEGLEERLTIKEINDGNDFVYSPEAVDTYGWIFRKVVWDNVNTLSALKSKGEKYLSEVQFENMSIEAKAIDLCFIDGSSEQFKLGDKIRVVSSPHGLDKFFPLTKMTIYLDSISKNTVTLGTVTKLSLTDSNVSTDKDIQNKIDSIPSKSDLLQEAIDNATALINQKTTGFVTMTGDELLIMNTNDKETATQVWRWNLNGLGYSSNGYAGPFETAITMDGQIVGKRIVAGSIAGEKLDITYRKEVEQKISDSEKNSNDYTDGKLGDYYTKVETESSIKNSADSIKLSVKETVTQEVSEQMGDYATTETLNAQIKLAVGKIESEVTRATNAETTLGSKITQTDGKIETEIKRATSAEGSLSSRITQTESSISSKVEKNGIISAINQTAEQITISAGKINLNGAVTANNNVVFGLDGTISAKNGKFEGIINGTSMIAKKYYYLTDRDFNSSNKIIVISAPSDFSSDTEVCFGRVSLNPYSSLRNMISFKDMSQDRSIDVYTDWTTFYCNVCLTKTVDHPNGANIINPYSSNDDKNGTIYFGPGSATAQDSPQTILRGTNVRLYALAGGGVYLGASGTTAITSDENLKHIYDIDERYEKFFDNLTPVTYVYKQKGHRKHIGFGARAVEQALLSAGLTTEEFAGVLIDRDITIDRDETGTEEDVHYDELYSLRPSEFIALNTYKIKKLIKRVEELEAAVLQKG